ncbi:MAG: Gfo/Idh/MocA family oxidoreductase [Planctomycetes bacterium]|nr:Gfo/Idh/MocA family oxidoreductase [Planctomycetota bacterium]
MSDLPIAVVGLNFGRHICDELAARPGGVRLAAVCDQDAAKAQALAAKHGVPSFTSLDELLARPELPVIGLFTGPNGRAALLRRILAAGKEVMTTKPFERDSAAAAAVLAEARSLGRVLWLNSPSQALPADLALMQELAAQHDLGRPVAARAEVWAEYREKADGSWYDDPAQCPVAPVYRLGIYLINDLLRLLGPVEQVHVQGSRLFTGRPTADQGLLSLRFRSGALASVFASFCIGDGDHYRNSLAVNHERGSLYRNVGPLQLTGAHSSDGCQISLVARGAHGREVRAARWAPACSGGYDWAGFAAAVRARTPPDPATVATIVGAVQVIEAMAASEASGLPATVRA